jgi:Ser/Thr protein kinase RdoA (MazF antagonist)
MHRSLPPDLRPVLPVRRDTPIAPLSTEDYESCAIVIAELDITLEKIQTPALRRRLGDMRARIRAAMDGYEAVNAIHAREIG